MPHKLILCSQVAREFDMIPKITSIVTPTSLPPLCTSMLQEYSKGYENYVKTRREKYDNNRKEQAIWEEELFERR